MEELRRTNTAIPECWSDHMVEEEAQDILSSEPFLSVLKSKGAFYIHFARSDRKDLEKTAFLTERGGVSTKRKKRNQDSKKSRPILLKSDGTVIKPPELWNAGFLYTTLREGRNPTRYSALEKVLHQKTLHLPLGQRLHRDYCGGAKIRKDSLHMTYGVYLTYHPDGIPARFNLNP